MNRIIPVPQSALESTQSVKTPPQQTEEQETSNYWADNNSQSDIGTMKETVSHMHIHEPIAYLGSEEPVVTSHGKVCMWCEQGSEIDYQHDQGQHEFNKHDENLKGSSGEAGPSDCDNQPMPMDDRTETFDDDNSSTHESGIFLEDNPDDAMSTLPRIVDDNEIEDRLPNFLYHGLKRQLEQMGSRTPSIDQIEDDDWPSDGGYQDPNTPTPGQRNILRPFGRGSQSRSMGDRRDIEYTSHIQWWSEGGWRT